jgi:two-component system CheB/CheR fusion protein
LQTKVADLSRANNDMNNLLAGTGIATVFVDHGLHILRFTPAATQIINLILSDVGRPVGHIVSNLVGYDHLPADTQAVLNTLVPKEVEVQTRARAWYAMRIQPYRTLGNVIEGAVITFIDISAAKSAQEALRLNEERFRAALKASPVAVYNQDRALRYTWIHSPDPWFSEEKVLGKTDADLLPAKEAEILTAIKRRVLESEKGTRQMVRVTTGGKTCFYDLTVEPQRDIHGAIIGITCSSVDITDRRPKDRLVDTPQDGC